MQRQADLFQIILALTAPRRFAACWTAGSSSATSTAMMAITTSSSIRVKRAASCFASVLFHVEHQEVDRNRLISYE